MEYGKKKPHASGWISTVAYFVRGYAREEVYERSHVKQKS